jgi:hypothetical protein
VRLLVSAALIATTSLLGPAGARAAEAMYREPTLERARERYEQRIAGLYERAIRAHLPAEARDSLAGVRFELRLAVPDERPVDFSAPVDPDHSVIVLRVQSLRLLEDLATAYAWLTVHGYSFSGVDEYTALLAEHAPEAFPGERYPTPLESLGIPRNAAANLEIDEISVELRNSAYAFVLVRALGLLHLQRANLPQASLEESADAFALDVLERADITRAGAILVLRAQAGGRTDDRLAALRHLRIARQLDASLSEPDTPPLALPLADVSAPAPRGDPCETTPTDWGALERWCGSMIAFQPRDRCALPERVPMRPSLDR